MSLHFDFAYLDPGTGSLFIQAVIGVVVSGAFIFRNFIARAVHKLKSLASRSRKASAPVPDEEAE